MPASQQSWHTRADQCPTGALIATRPRNAKHRPLRLAERFVATRPPPHLLRGSSPRGGAFTAAVSVQKTPGESLMFLYEIDELYDFAVSELAIPIKMV